MSKSLMKENPFKTTVVGGSNFVPDKKTYGLEGSLPPVPYNLYP